MDDSRLIHVSFCIWRKRVSISQVMAPRRKTSGAAVINAKSTRITNNNSGIAIKSARGNRRNTFNININYTNLQITDVLCPLCRNILIEPITLPCQHCFCWRCLQAKIVQRKDWGTETCPQCQARFGSWYRTAKKQQKLLTNQPLWNAIREMFLKPDNPLSSFLSNGLKRKLPVGQEASSLSSPSVSIKQIVSDRGRIVMPTEQQTPSTLLLTLGNDSNDSSCAEDSIRRECNHFRPIEWHNRGDASEQSTVGQGRLPSVPTTIPTIIRVPAIRPGAVMCDNPTVKVRAIETFRTNAFFSDPTLSAFYIVPGSNQVRCLHDGTELVPDDDVNIENNRKQRKILNNQQKHDDDEQVATIERDSDAVSATRSRHKNTINLTVAHNMHNRTKRNCQRSVRQRGGEPQARRQSARIIAAMANNHCNNVVTMEHVGQLEADQQLARELHRLLNGGATRRTTKVTAMPTGRTCAGTDGRGGRVTKLAGALLNLRPSFTMSRVK